MPGFLFALTLLGQTPADQGPLPADSYADSSAAYLVTRARAARDRNERLVTSYTATVTQRMGAGIRALSRDRMLFHQELAAKISWKRDAKSSIEVTGARQELPVVTRGAKIPSDLDSQFRWLVVNPAEDYLGMIGSEDDGFVYPLRAEGERDYRFATGDTTVITLATGKQIRLLQLVITPRRSDWKLMSGSLWFDADTYGLVRAVFRPARPYDFRRDAEAGDTEDVPSWVNPKAEIKFITMEYGLYENRWWMLRYAALDGMGNMGSWLGVPVKFERVYSDYEVEGGTPPPAGSTFRPAGTVRRRDSTTDERMPSSAERRARRDSLRAIRRACLDRLGEEEDPRACLRRQMADPVLEVLVPKDTLSLLSSVTLGPPVLEMGDLITESELRGMADAIQKLPGVPLGGRLEMPKGVSDALRYARYNRVEGLSVGYGGSAQQGRLVVDGTGRIGLADGVPRGELGFSLLGKSTRFRLGGYRRLAAMNPDTKPFGVVNSVFGLLAQRDDGEYFRSLGSELTGENSETGWWSFRLYYEQQRFEAVETSFSLPHVFSGERHFRANTPAERANQAGAVVTLRGSQPLSRTVQVGGDLTLDGGVGDFEFGRGSAAVRAIVTPRQLFAIAVEAAAGASEGTVPLQNRFYLGGPATLRGYDGAAIAGASFWRARLEVANSFPGARLALFGDAGWAGPRRDFSRGKPLLSAGAGVSLLDGLVRLDLAHALRAPKGWRFDLYFDGRL